MITSELITTDHRTRKALIYIRQSTPHQVLTNQESLRLQYALHQRAIELGWREEDIEIIDRDLGMTGAAAELREGFKEVVAKVTLGQVGILLSSEVTRLSRNCTDWYPLPDVCGFRNCLIADRDGIYDPASTNGRLLLGLKGQLSELELHTIRGRMTAGLLNKAQRGELALPLPVGLVRSPNQQVLKDPNLEVQNRLSLVFSTFLRVKSASKVLQCFLHNQLHIPRRNPYGDLVWRKPSVAAILSILKNPAYAGAFVYGRTRTSRHPNGKASTRALPMEQWKIIVKDQYPAYINWDTYQCIQSMLRDNYAEYDRNQSRGVPRPGAVLLQGMVYCGECGHRMVVQYKGGNQYLCNYLRQEYGVPVCQRIPADPIDAQVVHAFFQALSPIELNAYEQSLQALKENNIRVKQAQEQQLKRLRYQADLAQRQYDQVDPDNRLVAAELERRWETALVALKQAEEAFTLEQQSTMSTPTLPAELKAAFTAIGQKLPQIWGQETLLPTPHKKALLRCLIDKVVIHRLAPDQVQTRIVWKGGATTTLQVPVTVGSLASLSNFSAMEQLILDLCQQKKTDEEIADHLTNLGYRSPMNLHQVIPSTVKAIRLRHRIFHLPRQSHPRHIPGFLTVPQLAQLLEVNPSWLYDRIHNGSIQMPKDPQTGLYLFADTPETLEKLRRFKSGILKNLCFS
jgi:DNA invertase Pin-like site-specific DNA recombinase/predicted DNA-binding transcriptional regulator AlpA